MFLIFVLLPTCAAINIQTVVLFIIFTCADFREFDLADEGSHVLRHWISCPATHASSFSLENGSICTRYKRTRCHLENKTISSSSVCSQTAAGDAEFNARCILERWDGDAAPQGKLDQCKSWGRKQARANDCLIASALSDRSTICFGLTSSSSLQL